MMQILFQLNQKKIILIFETNNESFSEKNLNHFYAKEKEQRNTNNNTTNYQVNSTNIENSENHFGVGYEEAMSGYDNENKSKSNIKNNYKNLKAVWLIKLLSLLCT